MRDGRSKVNHLNLRLEAVKTKIDECAKRDVECETRLERRLKMLWGCLGFWMILLLGLVVVRQRGVGVDVRGGELINLEDVNRPAIYRRDLEEELREIKGGEFNEPKATRWEQGHGVDAEATLRLFDEL